MKLTTTIRGAKDLTLTISELEAKHFRKAARKAVNEGTKLILAAAKANVSIRTGSLRKSLGRKVKAFKNGTGYYGIVGPRKDNKAKIAQSVRDHAAGKRKTILKSRFRKTIKYKGREITVNPVKYAHLVEFGRRAAVVRKRKVMSDGAVVFGTKIKSIPPRPFLRPAWDQNKAAVEAIVRKEMAKAVTEAGRKSGRGKR